MLGQTQTSGNLSFLKRAVVTRHTSSHEMRSGQGWWQTAARMSQTLQRGSRVLSKCVKDRDRNRHRQIQGQKYGASHQGTGLLGVHVLLNTGSRWDWWRSRGVCWWRSATARRWKQQLWLGGPSRTSMLQQRPSRS